MTGRTLLSRALPVRRPGAALDDAQWDLVHLFFGVCLFATLWTICVQISYLAAAATEDQNIFAQQAIASAAEGNPFRQLFYPATLLAFLFVSYTQLRQLPFQAVTIPYNLACFWCILSCVWAISPGISIRRSISMYIILTLTCGLVYGLGARRTIKVLYLFFATTLVLSLISVALSPISLFSFSVHPTNEDDPSLIGAWRGIFLHKNISGAVMTHASALFLHVALSSRRMRDWGLFAGSALFVVFTKSKTSIGLEGVILSAGLLYRFVVNRPGGNQTFAFGFFYVLFNLAVVAFAMSDDVLAYLQDPASFSNRVAIWISLISYIKTHFWLGSGYGSFWTIGQDSPIYAVAIRPFIYLLGHSHSGYFEVLVTTGVIGLTLAVFALVVWPLYRFLSARPQDAILFAPLFSMWLFGILQNFTESQFFSPDRQSWIFVVIAISIAHHRTLERLHAARRPVRRRRPASRPRPATTPGPATPVAPGATLAPSPGHA